MRQLLKRILGVVLLLLAISNLQAVPPKLKTIYNIGDGGDTISVSYERMRRDGSQRNRRVTRGPGLFSYDFPRTGEQKALVILVEFQDVRFGSKNSEVIKDYEAKSYFHNLLNTPGFTEFGATGSARDWFIDNSNSQFKPQFDVYGPVLLANSVAYYGKNIPGSEEDSCPWEMVTEACRQLDEKIDFREYDRDRNGSVDNVFIVYAGYGEADSYDKYPNTVWPHAWSLTEAINQPLNLDGVKIDMYACTNEVDYGYKGPVGIGTFVHEFSHVIGLPDLYPTKQYSSTTDEPFTPGEYSVMDYGPYNNNGHTPPNYSAYERFALGWLSPDTISSHGEYSLQEIGSSNRAYIALTEREQEYFLFENRIKKGWDKYLPGEGMLVWHVDYNKDIFVSNTVNNDKSHQYVDLVEADNRATSFTLGGDPFPGDSMIKTFGPSTRPALRSWGGESLGITLSNIDLSAERIIRFSAEVERSGINDIIQENNKKDVGVPIYDLLGRIVGYTLEEGRLPELTSGIYIISGKKIFIR